MSDNSFKNALKGTNSPNTVESGLLTQGLTEARTPVKQISQIQSPG